MKLYCISDWLTKVDLEQPHAMWAVHLIESYLDINIQKMDNGKPIIVDQLLYINWSHNERYLIVALSERGPVGIDAEQKQLIYDESLYGWVLHPYEQDLLARGTLFSEIWTRKEAYLKLVGTGLHEEMSGLNSYSLGEIWVHTMDWNELCISVCSPIEEKIDIQELK